MVHLDLTKENKPVHHNSFYIQSLTWPHTISNELRKKFTSDNKNKMLLQANRMVPSYCKEDEHLLRDSNSAWWFGLWQGQFNVCAAGHQDSPHPAGGVNWPATTLKNLKISNHVADLADGQQYWITSFIAPHNGWQRKEPVSIKNKNIFKKVINMKILIFCDNLLLTCNVNAHG